MGRVRLRGQALDIINFLKQRLHALVRLGQVVAIGRQIDKANPRTVFGGAMHHGAEGGIGAIVDRDRRALGFPHFVEDHPRHGQQLDDRRQRPIARDDGFTVGIVGGDDAVDGRQGHAAAPLIDDYCTIFNCCQNGKRVRNIRSI